MAMILGWNGWSIMPLSTGAGALSIAGNMNDITTKTSAAIQLLMSHSGVKRLEFEAALVDHTVPPDAVTIPGNRPGEIRVPLISIFSNELPSFKKRPSQQQVDRLSQIIGKQTRWWVDYEDPRSYDYQATRFDI